MKKEELKQEQKKILIDMMQEDEDLGLYNEPKQDKVCIGCGILFSQPLGKNELGENFLACCPDSNYVDKQKTLEQKLDKIVSKEPSKFWAESDERFKNKETLEEVAEKDGTIIQFLCGSHSYDGVWFGNLHPNKKGVFWWRSILKEWQQEQDKKLYNEEDIDNLISDILYEVRYDYSDIDIIESNIIKIFNQFKNK